MKDTCVQCGGEVEIIREAGSDICYRCRCGMIGKWWTGDEDGPPMDAVDHVRETIKEIAGRIERLTTVMNNLDALILQDDLEANAIKGVVNANRWLEWTENGLKRYYNQNRMLFDCSRPPIELIDADAAIKAAIAKPDEPT